MKKYLSIYLALLIPVSLAVTLLTCGGGGGDGQGTGTITPSLTINGPTEINENESTVYIATMTWEDGSTEIVTCGWAVNPTTYASMGSNGVLNALSVPENQTCWIAAAYMSGGNTYTANMEVTIIDVSEPPSDNTLLLDGVNDRAEATDSVFPDTSTHHDFTVEAWIYPTAAGSFIVRDDAYSLIVYLDPNPGIANDGIGIKFSLWDSTCGSTLNSLTEFRDVTLNQWNHVAGIFDASTQQYTIAINGILGSPVSYSGGLFCNDANMHFTVGGYYGSNDGTFQGNIDEVRVSSSVRYNSNFTPSDTFSSDANTEGLWHFDEFIGSTSFSDSSGNGNTLTGLNGARNN